MCLNSVPESEESSKVVSFAYARTDILAQRSMIHWYSRLEMEHTGLKERSTQEGCVYSALIGGLLADCTGLLCTSFQFGSIQGCVKAVSQLTWRLRMGPRLDTSRVGATGKAKLQLHPLTARHAC